MKLTEFTAKRQALGIEGTGVDTTATKERTWKDKTTGAVTFTIPAGTKVHVDFSPKLHANALFITVGDQVKISRVATAGNWLRGFRKPPGIRTLEKHSNDGVTTTLTGHRVEPDGYGPDGSPSWLLVLGVI